MTPRDDTPWLHIRSQFTYHAEAEIAGTREGLRALKAAVDRAIETGEGEAQVFASDGEGYGVYVRLSSTVRGIGKPTYLNEEARQLAYHEFEYLTRTERSNREVLARIRAAQGIEAGTATTLKSGVVHDSPVGKADAPNPEGSHP